MPINKSEGQGMNSQEQTEAIGEVWFLYSQHEQPMGRVYRREGEPAPQVALRFQHGDDGQEVEIVEFRELGPTCLMRRFRVVVRVVTQG